MSNINLKKQKGISVLYAIFLTGIFLAIGFGISGILIQQIRMMSGIGHSVVALYAADSGIEEILMNRENASSSCLETIPCFLDSANEISYYLDVKFGDAADLECDESNNYCIKSIGNYQKTKRAIEINY